MEVNVPSSMRGRIARRLAVLVALVGCLVLVLMVKPAAAIPCQETITTYYSDSQCTQWEGQKKTFCTKQSPVCSGSCTSQWKTVDYQECCGCESCYPTGTFVYSCQW